MDFFRNAATKASAFLQELDEGPEASGSAASDEPDSPQEPEEPETSESRGAQASFFGDALRLARQGGAGFLAQMPEPAEGGGAGGGSIWQAAAGFGRQLLQEIQEPESSSPDDGKPRPSGVPGRDAEGVDVHGAAEDDGATRSPAQDPASNEATPSPFAAGPAASDTEVSGALPAADFGWGDDDFDVPTHAAAEVQDVPARPGLEAAAPEAAQVGSFNDPGVAPTGETAAPVVGDWGDVDFDVPGVVAGAQDDVEPQAASPAGGMSAHVAENGAVGESGSFGLDTAGFEASTTEPSRKGPGDESVAVPEAAHVESSNDSAVAPAGCDGGGVGDWGDVDLNVPSVAAAEAQDDVNQLRSASPARGMFFDFDPSCLDVSVADLRERPSAETAAPEAAHVRSSNDPGVVPARQVAETAAGDWGDVDFGVPMAAAAEAEDDVEPQAASPARGMSAHVAENGAVGESGSFGFDMAGFEASLAENLREGLVEETIAAPQAHVASSTDFALAAAGEVAEATVGDWGDFDIHDGAPLTPPPVVGSLSAEASGVSAPWGDLETDLLESAAADAAGGLLGGEGDAAKVEVTDAHCVELAGGSTSGAAEGQPLGSSPAEGDEGNVAITSLLPKGDSDDAPANVAETVVSHVPDAGEQLTAPDGAGVPADAAVEMDEGSVVVVDQPTPIAAGWGDVEMTPVAGNELETAGSSLAATGLGSAEAVVPDRRQEIPGKGDDVGCDGPGQLAGEGACTPEWSGGDISTPVITAAVAFPDSDCAVLGPGGVNADLNPTGSEALASAEQLDLDGDISAVGTVEADASMWGAIDIPTVEGGEEGAGNGACAVFRIGTPDGAAHSAAAADEPGWGDFDFQPSSNAPPPEHRPPDAADSAVSSQAEGLAEGEASYPEVDAASGERLGNVAAQDSDGWGDVEGRDARANGVEGDLRAEPYVCSTEDGLDEERSPAAEGTTQVRRSVEASTLDRRSAAELADVDVGCVEKETSASARNEDEALGSAMPAWPDFDGSPAAMLGEAVVVDPDEDERMATADANIGLRLLASPDASHASLGVQVDSTFEVLQADGATWGANTFVSCGDAELVPGACAPAESTEPVAHSIQSPHSDMPEPQTVTDAQEAVSQPAVVEHVSSAVQSVQDERVVMTAEGHHATEEHYIGDSGDDAEDTSSKPKAKVPEWLDDGPEEAERPDEAAPIKAIAGAADEHLAARLRALEEERDKLAAELRVQEAMGQRLLNEASESERALKDAHEAWAAQLAAVEANLEQASSKQNALLVQIAELETHLGQARSEHAEEEKNLRSQVSTLEVQLSEARKGQADVTKDLRGQVSTLENQLAKAREGLDRARHTENRLLEENKDMEKELLEAQERWRGQIRAAEQTAEEARKEATAEVGELRARVDALLSEKAALEAASRQATSIERQAREESANMEQELLGHQERWKKQLHVAEQAAQEAQAEQQRLRRELAAMKEETDGVVAGEAALRAKVQADLQDAQRDRDIRLEELRAAAEVEAQLRREGVESERARSRLEERVAELTSQLERSQASYAEAVREVGTMASRLDEFEFASHAKSGSDDVVRGELAAARERHADLEKQLTEASWMRDYALQQAEAARGEAQRHREEIAGLAKELDDLRAAAGDAAADATGAPSASAADIEARLASLRAEHAQELQRAAAAHREEVEFLRRKGEEKDRKVETLICERNAFRLEASEKISGSGSGSKGKDVELLDLEDGLVPLKPDATAAETFAREGDLVLRRFTRILFMSKTMRAVFFGYLALLHIWVWIILHHTASARTNR